MKRSTIAQARAEIKGARRELSRLERVTAVYPDTKEEAQAHCTAFVEIANEILSERGERYRVDDATKTMVMFMVAYINRWEGLFARASQRLKEMGMAERTNIHAPIVLVGSKGVGKTLLMDAAEQYAREATIWARWFLCTSSQELLNHYRVRNNIDFYTYNTEKKAAIEGYTFLTGVHSFVLNDLGTEKDLRQRHYGADLGAIVEEFLMARYDLYQRTGAMLHVTSNLAPNDLYSLYSPRVQDRLKASNFIFWEGQSKRY